MRASSIYSLCLIYWTDPHVQETPHRTFILREESCALCLAAPLLPPKSGIWRYIAYTFSFSNYYSNSSFFSRSSGSNLPYFPWRYVPHYTSEFRMRHFMFLTWFHRNKWFNTAVKPFILEMPLLFMNDEFTVFKSALKGQRDNPLCVFHINCL